MTDITGVIAQREMLVNAAKLALAYIGKQKPDVKALANGAFLAPDNMSETVRVMSTLHGAIELAKLDQYDPWIHVTRSLPEQTARVPETAMWVQSEEVWVVVNHHGNRYIESAILRDGQWSIRNHGGFGWHERVTHWMPKPALPKV